MAAYLSRRIAGVGLSSVTCSTCSVSWPEEDDSAEDINRGESRSVL